MYIPVHVQSCYCLGADPKSVLCEFFKQGLCTKGDKCKFSHDLNLERKSEKRSMYVDMRDGAEDTGGRLIHLSCGATPFASVFMDPSLLVRNNGELG